MNPIKGSCSTELHPAVCWLVCVCVLRVPLFLCVSMSLVRQIMNAQHAFSDFNPKLSEWATSMQRFVFINIMHIDSLICFHRQISLGVCLSLNHTVIGYLFPIILIQTTCP